MDISTTTRIPSLSEKYVAITKATSKKTQISAIIATVVVFLFTLLLILCENGCQNVKKKYFLCFIAHESIIDGFCEVFLIYFFLVSLERNNLYLTFKYIVDMLRAFKCTCILFCENFAGRYVWYLKIKYVTFHILQNCSLYGHIVYCLKLPLSNIKEKIKALFYFL